MGLIKSILNQVLKSKSGSGHRRHRSYSSSDRYSRKGSSHNQYGHGHYRRKRGSSSYSSS
ncbi:hypothetical protein [Paenibacillus bovis]|uniref:Uncharacterized protein n=1 Tax=Paenibacillus bovis TaxID=1616788 RepID=A0A172ZBV3_9BACL|nr:hypothetical protein [Paenibacillus bovis]ANF94747.1 hypothetical protein AR543_01000 [Paenibacillus bovis]